MTGKHVPGGEKKGLVGMVTPWISSTAVAVPTWVMFSFGATVTGGNGCRFSVT